VSKGRTGGGLVIVGSAEVGLVKDVEELRAEVEPQLFGQWKLPLNGEIDLGVSEARAAHYGRNRPAGRSAEW